MFPYKTKEDKPSSSNQNFENIEEISQELDDESEDEIESELPRRSKQARLEKSFGSDFCTHTLEAEPLSYKEVVNSVEGHLWKDAIRSEIDLIMHNHT